MQPGNLTKGRAYYRVAFADPRMTIPSVEPMIYVGKDIFPGTSEPESRYYFQDTVSFHQHGNCMEYSGSEIPEDDAPFNVYSFTASELEADLVELPDAIRLLTEAQQRGPGQA